MSRSRWCCISGNKRPLAGENRGRYYRRALKPYYQDSAVTIYHGDCREVLAEISPVDLIFTSPPYNKGMRIDGRWVGRVTATCKGSRFADGYGAHSDNMPMPAYEQWQREMIDALFDLLLPSGAMFYNHKPRVFNGVLWTPLRLVPETVPLRQIITWHIGPGINVMPYAFTPSSEWILLFARQDFRLSPAAASVGDVWKISSVKSGDHPAPFPMELPQRAILASEAQRILDPFMGSGTTLRAAKDLGRKAIGIEIEEKYCEIAAKRMAQEVLPLVA